MFTGIIECFGIIKDIKKEGTNIHYYVDAPFTDELKIDQSVAHNGVCLTVVSIKDSIYKVTAIEETIKKSNLEKLQIGDIVNLERGMKMNARLDGHIVQGHVDETAKCISIDDADGSWNFTFEYSKTSSNITIEKGSITVNGVSLTVINSKNNSFSVSIIPFTYDQTIFHKLSVGETVNLEFDVIGKYVSRLHKKNN